MRNPLPDDGLDGGSPNITVEALDVTDRAARTRVVQRTIDRHGGVDILVNNAGSIAPGPTEEISETVAREQFETNFWGAYGLIREVLPSMIAHRTGRIVNVTSVGALLTLGFFTLYCATKHALDALTLGLDIELQPFGIRAVSVVPGGYATNLAANRARTDQPDSRYPQARTVISAWEERIASVPTCSR